ncbi:hypothetical protein l11_03620 [Neisseria weaveri LMG 5135]|nr:hypothetical protein l13_08380 [Neisseria weaveri ATCC 51223]EGV38915.1 hypothetical protein l11_03620 [Neisseria weaveri LMG 5135]
MQMRAIYEYCIFWLASDYLLFSLLEQLLCLTDITVTDITVTDTVRQPVTNQQ